MTAQENGWLLDTAVYNDKMRSDDATLLSMSFNKGKEAAAISIKQYDDIESAKNDFQSPRSVGTSNKVNGFGQEAEKVFVQGSGFAQLRFRNGNFIVSVFCRNEQLAEKFANYALTAVADLALKD